MILIVYLIRKYVLKKSNINNNPRIQKVAHSESEIHSDGGSKSDEINKLKPVTISKPSWEEFRKLMLKQPNVGLNADGDTDTLSPKYISIVKCYTQIYWSSF